MLIKKAFTLIELMVVIIIIGILAAITAPLISGGKARPITDEAKGGILIIAAALQQYHLDWKAYPALSADNSIVMMEAQLSDLSLRGLGTTYGTLATDGRPPMLDGPYFSQECYYTTTQRGSLEIGCTTDGNTAPGAAVAASAVQENNAATAYISYYPLTKTWVRHNWRGIDAPIQN